MSEQTANPESTTPDAEGADAVDSSSEIEKLDESLSDMTSALLGEASDDDMDFEGMFAEIEPPSRATPATPDDTPAAAESDSGEEQADASVSEQLDEIEAAVAAAIDEADADLAVDEAAVAEPAATEDEADPAETPTAVVDPDDTDDAAEPSDSAAAEPEDPMEAVAQELETTDDAAEAVAEPREPTPADISDAPPEPEAAEPEAEAEPEVAAESEAEAGESEPEALDAEVPATDADAAGPEAEAEPVEPEAEATEPEPEPESESAPLPESSGEATSADSTPEDEPSATADSPAAEAETTAEANPDSEGVASSEDAPASDGTDLPGAESAKSPGGRGLPAGVLAVFAMVGPVAGRLAKPVLDRMGVQVARGAEAVAGSFTGQPKLIRHSVAWIALWTLFNAGVVWAYLGLFRSGSPTPPEGSGTQITGASVAPDSVIGAGAAGVPGMPASPSAR